MLSVILRLGEGTEELCFLKPYFMLVIFQEAAPDEKMGKWFQ